MKAITFRKFGDPDVLSLTDRPRPEPGPKEVRIKVRYAGVNFIDTILRRGIYSDTYDQTEYFEGKQSRDTTGGGSRNGRIRDRRVHDILPLEEASRAHRQLEQRETIGKILLEVS